ncbi:acetyl esterase/lipase [Erythromicrobium ramosum]|uniref:Acetyl esterase/lipase n=2 Tax=Erythrobacter ramosus TaxID=35811 RepID=A0A6I4UMJ3_9SPHN|nr:acetyl esterase/lipase [Erythrobacter ramosus]MXP39908.1 alpha/beta hydrolase fold domain-containing protein [Erythrobacter ramosus]
MNTPAKALIAAGALAVLASPILAQQRRGGERIAGECRAEIVALCGSDRSQMRSCLREKYAELSDGCQSELRTRMEARGGERGGGAAAQAFAPQTLAYGSDALQGLDLWVPEGAKGAPLVLFVHGGGWKRGSKSNAVGRALPGHMLAQGYAFASIDYRLVPAATVEQQAADVAAALAYLLKRADALGIDRSRVVLTGHSAGAHLVALVGTDERYLRAVGLSFADIDGVMPNDGAAYDVAKQVAQAGRFMAGTYKEAFGTDPARQRALSPTAHASAPNAPAFLLTHVQREDGVAQNTALAEALRRAGTAVEVGSFPGEGLRGHMEINRKLGEPDYPATPVMDAWLKKVLG